MEEDIQNYLPTVMFRGTCPVSKDVIVSTKNFFNTFKERNHDCKNIVIWGKRECGR